MNEITILNVDDDPFNRFVLSELIKKHIKWNIIEAINGK